MTRRQSVLVCVTDRRRFGLTREALLDRVRWAAAAGVDVIQIRERDLGDRALLDLVRDAVASAAESRTRVIVNDRADLARAARAAGVHLRADSIAAPAVRSLMPEALIGRSVHSLDGARAAAAAGGCDYLIFGTVFPSRGKRDGHPVAGVAALAAVCRTVTVPIVAIGGVDEGRAREAAAAGAAGVAAVELFMAPSSESGMRARVDAVRRAFDTPFAGCLQ